MLLGFCTHPCARRPLHDILPRIAAWGYQAVELSAWPQHPCHPAKIKKIGSHTIRQLLNQHGLYLSAIAAHTQWVGVHEVVTQRALDYTRLCIDIAADLGAPIVTTNSGGYPNIDRHVSWERLLSGLTFAAEYAEERGVILALEPHVNHIVFTWESARNAILQVGSPHLKVNFDASHWFITGFDDGVALEQLFPHVVHVHLKDYRLHQLPLADGRYDGEAEACALGEGNYDLAGHLTHLRRLGYDGVLSAELFVENLDAAAAKSAITIHQLLEENAG